MQVLLFSIRELILQVNAHIPHKIRQQLQVRRALLH